MGSAGTAKMSPRNRQGRHGSRTPRKKNRDDAVSLEIVKNHKFTPGGTRVPDGPPPPDPIMPPVPPIPMLADEHGGDVQECTSYVIGLYDTCESKPRGKLGDLQWKPKGEPVDDGVLSAQEAKQVWLEREIQSLKVALDRVAVPTQLQQSGYWNSGFVDSSSKPRGLPAAACTAHGLDRGHSLGGSGDDQLPDRAMHGGCGEPRLHDRAVHGSQHGGYLDQARALQRSEHGGYPDQARAPQRFEHGGHPDPVRASPMHGVHLAQDRAFGTGGGPAQRDRAVHMHGVPLGHGVGANGLFDKDPLGFVTFRGMMWGEVELEMG